MKDKAFRNNQQGSVLIYTAFLMLALSAIAMMTALLVYINIKASANSAQAMAAYYGAETGIEKKLFLINENRTSQVVSLQDTLSDIPEDSDLDESQSSYSIDVSDEVVDSVTFDLAQYDSEQVDFFNPDTGDTLISSDNGSINLYWNESAACSAANSEVEVSIRSFQEAFWSDFLNTGGTDEGVFIAECTGAICGDYDCCYNSLSLTQNFGYRVKLRPLQCDIEDMTFSVYSDTANVVFENYIILESLGENGDSSVKLKAETIWKPPLSGVGEYVLFSEEIITK